MIRMFAKRTSNQQVDAGSDEVIFGMSLPSGSRINKIDVDVHYVSASKNTFDKTLFTAMEMWILPVQDVDEAATYDTIWDQLVPKDTDVETVDLDTQAVDTTPFYEVGEPDWTQMLDVGLRPERLYHWHKMHTMANGSLLNYTDPNSPFNPLWLSGGFVNVRIRRKLHVRQPSILVLGFASPSLDDTVSTLPTALAENKWGQLKYVGHVMERALLHLFGVTEAGAETPWEEATALLKEHLEPDPYEQSGTSFASQSYQVITQGIVDHSVEGTLRTMQITTGR